MIKIILRLTFEQHRTLLIADDNLYNKWWKTMLEKELNELSDETILTLYKSIVPSTSIIESVNKKLEKQSADGILRHKKEQGKTNDSDF